MSKYKVELVSITARKLSEQSWLNRQDEIIFKVNGEVVQSAAGGPRIFEFDSVDQRREVNHTVLEGGENAECSVELEEKDMRVNDKVGYVRIKVGNGSVQFEEGTGTSCTGKDSEGYHVVACRAANCEYEMRFKAYLIQEI